MAEDVKSDLKTCREMRQMTQWAAAMGLGISEYTLARWEKGESAPDPDDVWRLERLYKAPGLWHRWMRETYESYRENYPANINLELPTSILNVRYQMQDVMDLQSSLERDALDGHIDDERNRDNYLKELDEMIAAAQEAKRRIKEGAR